MSAPTKAVEDMTPHEIVTELTRLAERLVTIGRAQELRRSMVDLETDPVRRRP